MWWFKWCKPGAKTIKFKIETDPRLFKLIDVQFCEEGKSLAQRKFKKGMNIKKQIVTYRTYESKHLNTVVTFANGVARTLHMNKYNKLDRELMYKKGLRMGTNIDKWIYLNIEDFNNVAI